MTAFFLLTCLYLAGWLSTARTLYQQMRPYTEPLKCSGSHHDGGHPRRCYQRSSFSSRETAAAAAASWALTWPGLLLILLGIASGRSVVWLLARGAAELPEEAAAKTARLERETGVGP